MSTERSTEVFDCRQIERSTEMGWTLSLSESLGCPESALKLVLGQLSGKDIKQTIQGLGHRFLTGGLGVHKDHKSEELYPE